MNNIESKTGATIKFKICFYIMSLWLLFILLFVLTVNISILFKPNKTLCDYVVSNAFAIVSLFCTIISLGITKWLQYQWKGVANPPHKIKSIKNDNYEYITFLSTCLMPLIFIDLTKTRYLIVLIILILVVGFIFINMNLYYGNPTLALMGYRLYKAEIDKVTSTDNIILITKDNLVNDSTIKWIRLDDFVWIAKEVKK